jgi:hypothetical protein
VGIGGLSAPSAISVGDFRRRFHEKGVKIMKTPIRRCRILTAITRR